MEFWATFALLLATAATAKAGKAFLPEGVPSVGERIVGGSNATEGQLPYQVGIFIQKGVQRFFCGGVLIAPNYVLTAAHCCVNANNATVILGTLEINNKNDPNRVEREVLEVGIRPHPDYDNSTFHNDICIIKLQEDVTFSDVIEPVELPPDNSYDYTNLFATASGWGLTSGQSTTISAFLQYVVMKIRSKLFCTLGFILFSYDPEIQLCTEGLLGRSVCSGDSGGPLTVLLNSITTLVALVSFGYANLCDIGAPQGFTLVGPYLEWIYANMV